ncbi:MAG TPA: polyprenyl diphosphate synthase [Steroidobacteraceae bacterium]|nr:polyprenyl diphosphate synthase [Steroidobacteraceae bacterium]
MPRSSPAAVTSALPRHIAIIMDGNGRWAQKRGQMRHAGHKAGLGPVRMAVEACAELGVEVLTLFAFSSENWQRPIEEVGRLMDLFMEALEREAAELNAKGVRVRFIGDRRSLSVRLQTRLNETEDLTRANQKLQLLIAVGYGGRWDITEAARAVARRCASGALQADEIDEATLQEELALGGLQDPDLFIRTGGEQRISNFLLWNLAYTELYFCDTLWPDFDRAELDRALAFFTGRQRRFGLTDAQAVAR